MINDKHTKCRVCEVNIVTFADQKVEKHGEQGHIAIGYIN